MFGIKKLLNKKTPQIVTTITLLLCYFAYILPANAQQVGKQNLILKNKLANLASYRINNHNSVNSLTCDTLTTITRKDTLTLYTITSTVTANNGGYVTGNNNYGDSAVATFIPVDTSIIPVGAQITGVLAVFYRYNNLGTNGTQIISVNIYTGDTIYGPTTTTVIVGTGTATTTATVVTAPIATATASLAAISVVTPVSNAVDSAVIPILSSNYQIPYLFSFATPVNAPDSGFFISLTLPTTVGDTAVLLCTRNDSSNVNYAWDYGINGWRAFSNSNDWTLYTSLTLFPVVCYQPAGIEQFGIQNSEFRICPNPTNGSITLQSPIALGSVQVYNMLGQVVYTAQTKDKSLSIDLSNQSAGVYYIQAQGSTLKVVKQ